MRVMLQAGEIWPITEYYHAVSVYTESKGGIHRIVWCVAPNSSPAHVTLPKRMSYFKCDHEARMHCYLSLPMMRMG